MNKTLCFITQGCRANQAESASLKNQFLSLGFDITEDFSHAHIIVINTCTVTQKSDVDTHRLIQKINRVNPGARLALIGCQAQILQKELLQYPHVFLVVGTEQKMSLGSLVMNHIMDSEVGYYMDPISNHAFTQVGSGIDRARTRVNLKIQDGCQAYCAYCIVPYARGRARSRVFENILEEARGVIEAQYQEIILTGINIGAYHNQGKQLTDVINAILKIPGLKRLRLSSIEPLSVSEELISIFARSDQLCRFLHIPLQSGSDVILKRMNRHYTVSQYQQMLSFVLKKVPDICIGTDVIVGFPGETEQAFEDTYLFLKESPFAYFHVFPYSDRSLTRSFHFPHKVSQLIKQKRSKILRDLSYEKRLKFSNTLLGTTQQVLFEGQKQGYWTGLTDHFMRVFVVSDQSIKNQLLPVRLEKIDGDLIIGKLISR